MRAPRLVLAIASFALASLFLLLDIVNVDVALGRTHVAIYPAAFFALAGLVLALAPLLRRSRSPRRGVKRDV